MMLSVKEIIQFAQKYKALSGFYPTQATIARKFNVSRVKVFRYLNKHAGDIEKSLPDFKYSLDNK